MLDQRAKTLLKTLIERYISEGQPVGSRTLARCGTIELSPATVRNVMADLEEMGFIISPHTSAGRIPTPRGYRLFVDTMLTAGKLERENDVREEVRERLHPDTPQKVIAAAAQVLSSLSQFAGVVMTPRRSQAFRQIEFLRLSEKRVLLIIVTPDGDVQNRIIFPTRDHTASELIEAANFINMHYSGKSFDEVRNGLRNELASLRTDMTNLMQVAVEAGSDAMNNSQETVVISGERRLLEVEDLSSSMVKLRKLFDVFDQKTSLLQLLDTSSRAQGVQIFIGGESQVAPLEDMTVITAPYRVNGRVVGTLGVIGPMRMAYDRVIPIVDITAKLLSNALSQSN